MVVITSLAGGCYNWWVNRKPEGGIRFDKYRDSANVQTDFELWEKAVRLIGDRQMPPPDEEQPTADAVIAITAAIEAELATFDCSAARHPGRVTLRRLNKAEYNNTIRDLTGLDLKLADDFPADDVGNGFDNVGDVLSIPPVLLEKYLAAAEAVADRIFGDEQTRLSCFLWSSMPDERLFELARSGKLTAPAVMAAEAKRMLADPRSRALVDNFAGQWLQLRDISQLQPDRDKFPAFDDDLRLAM